MPIHIGRPLDHAADQPLGLLSDCHRRIEHFLDVFAQIARRVAGGPLTADQRRDLESALAYFSTAAPRHTADEEESLFPRLRAIDDATTGTIVGTLDRLERDHEDAGRHHRVADALGRQWLDDGQLDAAAIEALGGHLAALEAMYREHIRIEERELFPAAALVLSAEQIVEVGREMSARRRIARPG